jgi:hypothetical protein
MVKQNGKFRGILSQGVVFSTDEALPLGKYKDGDKNG